MFSASISNPEVNELELKGYEGSITVIDDKRDLGEVLKKVHYEPFIGFDTETKPAFKKGEVNEVSLIQLAIPDGVFLIRINKTGLTNGIVRLFESEEVAKIGVALRDDIKDLKRQRHFNAAGFIELNQLVKEIGIESNGLRKLTAIILGFRISKSAQTSNWENAELTHKQKTYAATDAWVCYEMYSSLLNKGFI